MFHSCGVLFEGGSGASLEVGVEDGHVAQRLTRDVTHSPG